MIVKWTVPGVAIMAEFDHAGTHVLGAGAGVARVWDAVTGSQLVELPSRSGFIAQARWSPDDKLIFTAGFDATVRLWDAGGGLLAVLPNPDEVPLFAVGVSSDGQFVAAATQDGKVMLWRLPRPPADLQATMCSVPGDVEVQKHWKCTAK